MNLMDVSIVIPIYNSTSLIRDSVEQLVRALGSMPVRYEILLRDDGSSDRSRDVLEKLPAQFASVKVFSNEKNRGLGFTLRRLFADAQGTRVIYIDCDLPFGADVVKEVLARLEKYDIVVCSRYLGKKNTVSWPRKAASRAYYYLCKALFNIPVKDIGSGTVGFRKEALNRLDLVSDGFAIHAEMFARAVRCHSSIIEIGVEALGEENGNNYIFQYGFSILRETFKLKKICASVL